MNRFKKLLAWFKPKKKPDIEGRKKFLSSCLADLVRFREDDLIRIVLTTDFADSLNFEKMKVKPEDNNVHKQYNSMSPKEINATFTSLCLAEETLDHKLSRYKAQVESFEEMIKATFGGGEKAKEAIEDDEMFQTIHTTIDELTVKLEEISSAKAKLKDLHELVSDEKMA